MTTAMQPSLLTLGEPAVPSWASGSRVWLDEQSWVDVATDWLRGADEAFGELVRLVPWRQGRRRMYERTVDDPRLSRWYRAGDELPHPALGAARAALADRYGVEFGGVGLNYYRDGRDSVAFHRDRELRELVDTVVAFVTFGGRRPFRIRPRGGGASRLFLPGSGDLLVMGGACQARWEHSVPKVAEAPARIS
nr:alpha-ketoglutarate-dependent dioxygenase AlkB [Micromonospora sp. DSM 115978]